MAVVLMLGLVAGLARLPASAQTPDRSYIYGIDDNNDIWQVNPKPGQQSFLDVYNTGLAGQSNAFAFDRDRDQMFFVNPSGTFNGTAYTNGLFFWNKPAGTFSLLAANGSSYGVASTIPANAAYFDDAFWFFNANSLSLIKAPLTYTGGIPTGVGTFSSFLMDTGGALIANQNNFGDIAIDVTRRTLYAYTAGNVGGKFYSLNLDAPTSAASFRMIRASSALTPAVGLQISFNEDYTVLYGHNYDDGKWYEINTGNGDLTDLSFTTLVPGTSKGFRDLGGASVISVPEPATTGLMLAGAAAAVGTGLVRRRGLLRSHR